MRCDDCKGGVPSPLWRRCVPCAMKRLRAIMSDAPVDSTPTPTRRWKIRDVVRVEPRGGGPAFEGTVARTPQGNDFVVEREDGSRYYADVSELREP